MQVYPTRATFHAGLAGAALVALGAAARVAPIIAFGGAMLIAVALGRAFALIAVTKLRAAGFEMVWTTETRAVRAARGDTISIEAELRNRGTEAVRVTGIRPIASSMITVNVTPSVVDLGAGRSARVTTTIETKRVGRWGLHGLALEVRGTPVGGEGFYEVPLLFANPLGVEVLPKSVATRIHSPVGGRSRRASPLGGRARAIGEGDELRELREHVSGDAFKRIAWKASARRGTLLVREYERSEHDVIWIVIDGSSELWAGPAGAAPLDDGLDRISELAMKHVRRGDRVGVAIVGARVRTIIEPDTGAAHLDHIASALTSVANIVDADRTELDEAEIAQRVAEHARPLDPRGLSDVPRGDLDRLAKRAEELMSRAPFSPRVPHGTTAREKLLRQYLAAFGVEVPPRVDGEREHSEAALATLFDRFAKDKPKPDAVIVWGPSPSRASPALRPLRKLVTKRIAVRWLLPDFEPSLSIGSGEAHADVVAGAVAMRARAARERGMRVLRTIGVFCAARPKSIAPLKAAS